MAETIAELKQLRTTTPRKKKNEGHIYTLQQRSHRIEIIIVQSITPMLHQGTFKSDVFSRNPF